MLLNPNPGKNARSLTSQMTYFVFISRFTKETKECNKEDHVCKQHTSVFLLVLYI